MMDRKDAQTPEELNRKLRIVIVDDEEDAIEALEIIINDFCQGVEIVGTETSSLKAISLIVNQQPNLVFLDVEMPEMTGLELLENIPNKNFEVVFATAYKDFAIDAIKKHAFDYLLKPLSIKEVVSTVNKIIEFRNNNSNSTADASTVMRKKLAIKEVSGIVYLNQNDIINIEADSGYSNLYTLTRKITTTQRLNIILDSLDKQIFMRVHNSHIINVEHVLQYNSKDNFVKLSNAKEIPVSRANRDLFLEQMDTIIG